jgi:hypothetical protein
MNNECMSSRIIGSLGLSASGSVVTCMHKQNRKEIHTQISIYQGYKKWIRSADPTGRIGNRGYIRSELALKPLHMQTRL